MLPWKFASTSVRNCAYDFLGSVLVTGFGGAGLVIGFSATGWTTGAGLAETGWTKGGGFDSSGATEGIAGAALADGGDASVGLGRDGSVRPGSGERDSAGLAMRVCDSIGSTLGAGESNGLALGSCGGNDGESLILCALDCWAFARLSISEMRSVASEMPWSAPALAASNAACGGTRILVLHLGHLTLRPASSSVAFRFALHELH